MSSCVELANMIHAASDELCRLAGFDEDAMLNLGLALREATVNAMKHGNGMCEDKLVTVTFDLRRERLQVDVHDEGAGFDFDRNVDPRLPENIGRTSGRGLFLIRNFVDEVHFIQTPGAGTTVSLIKRIPRRTGRRGARA
ncbi:MAG TPA: ATP-binding protein [Candidatus Polarisedimenticolia bacterium]|nr:ATP-binding protein [Candidatus Polarisedimenticolia bacterium]